MPQSLLKPIVIATLIAGTLDILAAFFFAGRAGVGPVGVLHFVASGPFGDRPDAGAGFAAAGLAVHYAIMFCMVAAYMIAATRLPLLNRYWVVAGLAYGLLLWLIMYGVVRPARWPQMSLTTDPWKIADQWFCHLILVGLPIAWVARRNLGPRFWPVRR